MNLLDFRRANINLFVFASYSTVSFGRGHAKVVFRNPMRCPALTTW